MVAVIDNEELPKAFPSLEDLRSGHRALTPERKAELRELIRSTTLEAPTAGESGRSRNCLNEAREERYARLGAFARTGLT